jgi:hypothetical protein
MKNKKKSRKGDSYYSSGIMSTDTQLKISLIAVAIMVAALVICCFFGKQIIFKTSTPLIKYLQAALNWEWPVLFST